MRPKVKIWFLVIGLVLAGFVGLLLMDLPAPSAPAEQTVTLPAAQ